MSTALDVKKETFDSDVLNATTPVLVDFWASWCGPCKMLAPVVDEIATDFAGRVKVLKVNVDDQRDLATKFGIQGIPTLMIFKDGAVADRLVGAQPKSVIVAKLNDVLKDGA